MMIIKLEAESALVNACHCGDKYHETECEACDNCASFTWGACEICEPNPDATAGPLGGERHAVAVIFPGTFQKSNYYSACVDCVSRIEYGES